MPVLICKQIWFYSPGDERAFFGFAERIKGIRKIEGIRDEIHLHFSMRLSDASLRDLLALFYRYKIAMRQLSQFETARNRAWFCDRQEYWFKKVFAD